MLRVRIWLVAMVSLLAACALEDTVPQAGAVGRLAGRLVLSDDSVLESAQYRISRTGTTYTRQGDIPVDDSTVLRFRIGGIPAGTGYSIEITGTTEYGNTCEGESPFEILDDQVTQVSITIRCGAMDDAGDLVVEVEFRLGCPLVVAVSAIPGDAIVGSSVLLHAQVFYGDAPVLWTGEGGLFGTPHERGTTFTCGRVGEHELRVAIDEPDCHDARTITVACSGNGTCADGAVDPGEECDDANGDDTDGCTSTCKLARCGDGFVHAGFEACDDANGSNQDACLNTCVAAACGDGFTYAGVEACDDANGSNADACLNGCVAASCGDGFTYAGVEACDDANGSNTDACLNTCVAASCGDSFTYAGVEACDDANGSNTDACLNTCVEAACGDGFVHAGVEACDDANGSSTDACLNTCVEAACGDGFIYAGAEACDDGNGSNQDACLNTCAAASCGDGFVRSGVETCDDGNTQNGDGCSSACLPEPTQIVDGAQHSCARLSNGAVKCWGYNAFGQLGLGDTAYRGDGPGEMGSALPAVSLGTGRGAKVLTAGTGHTCALLDDDSVKCWGLNNSGQLGLGNTVNRGDNAGELGDSLPVVALGTGRTAKRVVAGGNHTCAVLDDDSVKCWGLNSSGQLGLGNTVNRGDNAGEMGNSLPVVALGTGRSARSLVAGNAHTCAVLDDATVKCWGLNGSGQLGLGDVQSRGDAAGEMGNALPVVALGTGRTAKVLAAGSSHVCALLDDDSLKCWGSNTQGQLGLGDVQARGDAAGEMGNALPVVALGTGRKAKGLTAGTSHSCALLDDDSLKCWGQDFYGQLGLGNTASRGDNAGEMGDALPVVALGAGRTTRVLTAGNQHTCALLDDGRAKCWGYNFYGQLGLGNTVNRGDNAGEMGDSLPAIVLW